VTISPGVAATADEIAAAAEYLLSHTGASKLWLSRFAGDGVAFRPR
jgi:hypothetical protein